MLDTEDADGARGEPMAAVRAFRWDFIAANSSANLFLHGMRNNEAVSFCIVVFAGSGAGVPNPAALATLTEGQTLRHVDGTVARRFHVQNNAPFNSCTVDLLMIRETF
jgi:hypothetical protein